MRDKPDIRDILQQLLLQYYISFKLKAGLSSKDKLCTKSTHFVDSTEVTVLTQFILPLYDMIQVN